VADLAGAAGAAEQPPVDHDPAADAGAEHQAHHRAEPAGGAEQRLGEAERAGVVDDRDRAAERGGQRDPDRDALPVAGEVGEQDRVAGFLVEDAGHAHADGPHRTVPLQGLPPDLAEPPDDAHGAAVALGGEALPHHHREHTVAFLDDRDLDVGAAEVEAEVAAGLRRPLWRGSHPGSRRWRWRRSARRRPP
jgi:hypothetical protein